MVTEATNTGSWPQIATNLGARSVLNPNSTEEQRDACTAEQQAFLRHILPPLLPARVNRMLDFGCGAGRLTGALASVSPDAWTWGYDPTKELLSLIQPTPGAKILYTPTAPWLWEAREPFRFDVVLVWAVLGNPHLNPPDSLAIEIANILSPEGLLVVVEHMENEQPEGKGWIFRPISYYRKLFGDIGITLKEIGTCPQLKHSMTALAGLRSS